MEPAGWADKADALLLKDAIPYFTSLIERNPKDWGNFRRAEANHALNHRAESIADYTIAIQLHLLLLLIHMKSFRAGTCAAWPPSVPGGLAWAYFSRALLIAAGAAIISGEKARVAAILAGTMIFL